MRTNLDDQAIRFRKCVSGDTRLWLVSACLVMAAVLALGIAVFKLLGEENTDIPRSISVFCGAGLMHPMEEIIQQFEDKEGVDVCISYGGSGVLLGRISMGRSCDVFIPGAAAAVDDAARNGWVDAASRKDIVFHVPVLAVSEKGTEKISSFEDISSADVRVGLGDSRACAIGETADNILTLNGLKQDVEANIIVRTPTVNQLLIYLVMNQIDAAIIWEDMIHLPEASGKVYAVSIPEESNIVETIAACRGSACSRTEDADAFMSFLTSPSVREVWLKWGFKPCGG